MNPIAIAVPQAELSSQGWRHRNNRVQVRGNKCSFASVANATAICICPCSFPAPGAGAGHEAAATTARNCPHSCSRNCSPMLHFCAKRANEVGGV